MKQLELDQWAYAAQRFAVDSIIEGTVTRLMELGAFVELEPGLEGLVHVCQLSNDRVRRPGDVGKPGQKLTVRNVSVEPSRSRTALSRLAAPGAMIGSEDSVDNVLINTEMKVKEAKPNRDPEVPRQRALSGDTWRSRRIGHTLKPDPA